MADVKYKAGDKVLIRDRFNNGDSIQQVARVRAGVVFIKWRGEVRKFGADGREIDGLPACFGKPYLIKVGAGLAK